MWLFDHDIANATFYFYYHSHQVVIDKHVNLFFSPLKESKLTNVIDAPKIQQCERLIEQEDQTLKKVKVQGQMNIDSMITVPKIPVVENVPEVVSLPPSEIRTPVPPVKGMSLDYISELHESISDFNNFRTLNLTRSILCNELILV